jgi:hypothetical protein
MAQALAKGKTADDAYGHYARKPTLILAYGIEYLPSLEWGYRDPTFDPALVARIGLKRAAGRTALRESEPPEPFRNLLISVARNEQRPRLLEAAE